MTFEKSLVLYFFFSDQCCHQHKHLFQLKVVKPIFIVHCMLARHCGGQGIFRASSCPLHTVFTQVLQKGTPESYGNIEQGNNAFIAKAGTWMRLRDKSGEEARKDQEKHLCESWSERE